MILLSALRLCILWCVCLTQIAGDFMKSYVNHESQKVSEMVHDKSCRSDREKIMHLYMIIMEPLLAYQSRALGNITVFRYKRKHETNNGRLFIEVEVTRHLLTVFLELRCRKTVRILEQIISKDQSASKRGLCLSSHRHWVYDQTLR